MVVILNGEMNMKIENEIPLVPLKDIAIIQKGVWITKKIKETYSLEYLEEKYGIKKNDVVISRTMYMIISQKMNHQYSSEHHQYQ